VLPFLFDPAASAHQNEEYTPSEGPDHKRREQHGVLVVVAKVATLALQFVTIIVIITAVMAVITMIARKQCPGW
jgi:hypothetical protein